MIAGLAALATAGVGGYESVAMGGYERRRKHRLSLDSYPTHSSSSLNPLPLPYSLSTHPLLPFRPCIRLMRFASVPVTIGGIVLSSLLSPSVVHAQNLEASNNVTALYGTWSSGSGGVTTGAKFANPLAYTFTYPATSGIAYSFDNDGHFEEAQYRFNSNASLPHCIQTVVIWQHGTYKLNTNGSLTLTPFPGDGRIQVQDPCAAVSNIIAVYEQQTYYSHWDIIVDVVPNNYMLELAKFDGSAMPGLYLQARPPNMLPTIQLTDQAVTPTTSSGAASATKRSLSSRWF